MLVMKPSSDVSYTLNGLQEGLGSASSSNLSMKPLQLPASSLSTTAATNAAVNTLGTTSSLSSRMNASQQIRMRNPRAASGAVSMSSNVSPVINGNIGHHRLYKAPQASIRGGGGAVNIMHDPHQQAATPSSNGSYGYHLSPPLGEFEESKLGQARRRRAPNQQTVPNTQALKNNASNTTAKLTRKKTISPTITILSQDNVILSGNPPRVPILSSSSYHEGQQQQQQQQYTPDQTWRKVTSLDEADDNTSLLPSFSMLQRSAPDLNFRSVSSHHGGNLSDNTSRGSSPFLTTNYQIESSNGVTAAIGSGAGPSQSASTYGTVIPSRPHSRPPQTQKHSNYYMYQQQTQQVLRAGGKGDVAAFTGDDTTDSGYDETEIFNAGLASQHYDNLPHDQVNHHSRSHKPGSGGDAGKRSAFSCYSKTPLSTHGNSPSICTRRSMTQVLMNPANIIQFVVLILLAGIIYDSHHKNKSHRVKIREYDEERAHILEQMMWIDKAAKKVHHKYSQSQLLTDLQAETKEELVRDAEHLREELDQLQLRIQLNARNRIQEIVGDNTLQVSLKLNEKHHPSKNLLLLLSDDAPHAVATFLHQIDKKLWDELVYFKVSDSVVQVTSKFPTSSPLLEFIEPSRGCRERGSVALYQQKQSVSLKSQQEDGSVALAGPAVSAVGGGKVSSNTGTDVGVSGNGSMLVLRILLQDNEQHKTPKDAVCIGKILDGLQYLQDI